MLKSLRFSFIPVIASLLIPVASTSLFSSNTYFFPQTAAGTAGDLTILTQFSVYNPTQNSAQIEMAFNKGFGSALTLHTASPDDETLTGDSSSLSFKLEAGTKYRINLSLAGPVEIGWTRVLSDVPLQISASYGSFQRVQAGGIGSERYVPLWEATVLPAEPSHELTFPVQGADGELVPGVSTNTGFGIANISTWGSANVTARLYNADGSLKGEKLFEVRIRGHIAEFLTELFTDMSFSNFHGVLKFSSNAPIAVVALKESRNAAGTTVYSTAPVQSDSSFLRNTAYELEENNQPNAQVIGAPSEIRGTINANFDGAEQDYFAVDLSQGQTVQAVLLTSFTGSPMTPDVMIVNAGQSLAVHGQPIMAGSTDACITHTATATARYLIRVASGNGFGRGFTYRLFVRVF